MNTTEIFREEVSKIPVEVRKQLDLSFAISDRIAQTLESKGLSVKEFARIAHTKETTVRIWLGGTHNFTLKTIAKISALLNIDLIKIY